MASALSIAYAPAARAQSYTCPEYGARTIELDDGSASATIYVSEDCSDGRSRFDGVVRDINCDARAGYLWMRFYNGDNIFPHRAEKPGATNGCHTESTFSFSSTNPNPNIYACVVAQNWGPTESSRDCAWLMIT
jgi:hypothetical protein